MYTVQTPYTEPNAYTTDSVLPSLLKRLLPANALREVAPDLVRLGGEGLAGAYLLLCSLSCTS